MLTESPPCARFRRHAGKRRKCASKRTETVPYSGVRPSFFAEKSPIILPAFSFSFSCGGRRIRHFFSSSGKRKKHHTERRKYDAFPSALSFLTETSDMLQIVQNSFLGDFLAKTINCPSLCRKRRHTQKYGDLRIQEEKRTIRKRRASSRLTFLLFFVPSFLRQNRSLA